MLKTSKIQPQFVWLRVHDAKCFSATKLSSSSPPLQDSSPDYCINPSGRLIKCYVLFHSIIFFSHVICSFRNFALSVLLRNPFAYNPAMSSIHALFHLLKSNFHPRHHQTDKLPVNISVISMLINSFSSHCKVS